MASVSVSLLLALTNANAQTNFNFVSCPIVRDTPTVPCWLSEHDGELYYLGIQTDVSADFKPPYLGHQVLVEGVITDRPRICGGVVLEPLKISVMPELDASCNTILPAEDRYTIDFNPRPPGPSGGRLAFAPPEPGDAAFVEPPPPEAETGVFTMTFDVNRSFAFRHSAEVMEIADYARRTDAKSIEIHGNRGATRLADGAVVTEAAGTAERRVHDVARLLGGLGLAAEISTSWSDQPVPADGLDDWMSRSVIVTVIRGQ